MTPLGRRIDARKDELGLSIHAVARHWSTYRKMITGGGGVERWVWRRAFAALGWDPDSVSDALAGGEPRPLRPPADAERDLVGAFEDAGAIFDGFAGTTDEERRIVLEILERGRRRRRAQAGGDNGRTTGHPPS